MKRCYHCKQELPPAAFHVDRRSKDGLKAACAKCANALVARWRRSNNRHVLKALKNWRRKNPDKVRAANQRGAHRSIKSGQRAANGQLRRQAARKRARWYQAEEVRRYYRLAATLRSYGWKVHVGHWVPLRSPVACGLHVQDNLAIEPAWENLSKGARVLPQGDPPAVSRVRAVQCAELSFLRNNSKNHGPT